ncbi:ATP-binding protein [Streptomyces sp. NPDC057654]|uniref:ATP-binding protein n=1 Tax=Streptomyces sp. NPDC057654 TaxID=3346196 RepID=UPI0036755B43
MTATFEIRQRTSGEEPSRKECEQVGVMRLQVRECLSAVGLDDVADDAELVVSEMVTNALVHSGGRKGTLSLSLRDDRPPRRGPVARYLRIDVYDGVPNYRPACRAAGNTDECGRGLVLVNAIADDRHGAWGISDHGATTWCELRLAAS